MKKTLSLILVLVLCLGLFVGCGGDGKEETVGGNDAGKVEHDGTFDALFDPADNVTINLYMSNNNDLEVENSYANRAIERVIGANVKVTEYDAQDQYDTMIAENAIPALTYSNGVTMGPTYGPMGAYVDWNTVIDQMPNAKAVISDPKWAEDVAKYTDENGCLWQLPIMQTGYASIYGYIYRQDIFEENDIDIPTTQEEFYDVLVELKGLYPNSYPFVMRQMNKNMQGLEAFAYPWGTNHQLYGYYGSIMKFDHENKNYYFAQTSDIMKECISFLHQLSTEGLMHPSSLTLDTQSWIEAMATGSSFITYDKMDRIAAIQNAAEDDTFALSGFAPIAMGEEGVAESKVGGPTNYSWLLAANISEEEKANTIKYVDWLYSQDGILVTNWGIEGESYEVAEDGTWKFKEDFVYEGSGLGVPSICAYRDIDVFKLAQEENVLEALEICLPYAKSPNDPMLHYTEDQQIEMDTYYQTVYDSSLANIQKFILGQRDIDTEWDAYVAEMEGMHLQELIDIHQAAYDRIYGGK